MHDATPGSAVVADRRPLERDLFRFLLKDEGFAVRAEAATMSDLLLALQRETPDAVVLHEHLARGHDDVVIEQVRLLAPEAIIVVVTGDLAGMPSALRAIADETIADGVGLAGLGPAVTRPREGPVAVTPPSRPIDHPVTAAPAPSNPRRRWLERLQGAVAASIVALAVFVLRDGGTTLRPTGDGEVSAAPSGEASQVAPGRPGGDPVEAQGTDAGDAVPIAVALLMGAGTPVAGGAEPGAEPTGAPTVSPTEEPTEEPTEGPTEGPTEEPTEEPTELPVPDEADPGPGSSTLGAVGGPPAQVVGSLKPEIEALMSQLRPKRHGPSDGPGGAADRGGPPAVGHSTEPGNKGRGDQGPPWDGGEHPGRGNANGRGGGGPPPGRGNGQSHGQGQGHGKAQGHGH